MSSRLVMLLLRRKNLMTFGFADVAAAAAEARVLLPSGEVHAVEHCESPLLELILVSHLSKLGRLLLLLLEAAHSPPTLMNCMNASYATTPASPRRYWSSSKLMLGVSSRLNAALIADFERKYCPVAGSSSLCAANCCAKEVFDALRAFQDLRINSCRNF